MFWTLTAGTLRKTGKICIPRHYYCMPDGESMRNFLRTRNADS